VQVSVPDEPPPDELLLPVPDDPPPLPDPDEAPLPLLDDEPPLPVLDVLPLPPPVLPEELLAADPLLDPFETLAEPLSLERPLAAPPPEHAVTNESATISRPLRMCQIICHSPMRVVRTLRSPYATTVPAPCKAGCHVKRVFSRNRAANIC
jgi:hypothetical protein